MAITHTSVACVKCHLMFLRVKLKNVHSSFQKSYLLLFLHSSFQKPRIVNNLSCQFQLGDPMESRLQSSSACQDLKYLHCKQILWFRVYFLHHCWCVKHYSRPLVCGYIFLQKSDGLLKKKKFELEENASLVMLILMLMCFSNSRKMK